MTTPGQTTAPGSEDKSTEAAKPVAPPDAKPATTQPGQSEQSRPDSTTLKIVKSVHAIYPMQAEITRMQGQVILKVSVNELGDVEDASVISGDQMFASSALDAIKKWKFEPFIKNGEPIKVTTKIPFDFAFAGNVKDDPRPIPPAKQSADSVKRVRISAGVSQGLLIHTVQPNYPPEARMSRIQGTVIMQAVIGKNGTIQNLKLISGHPALAPAAMGAVQQWRYRPYILNGEAVEVETQITVNFTLAGH